MLRRHFLKLVSGVVVSTPLAAVMAPYVPVECKWCNLKAHHKEDAWYKCHACGVLWSYTKTHGWVEFDPLPKGKEVKNE